MILLKTDSDIKKKWCEGMIKLAVAKKEDFEDYYKIRCGESDIFWMGFDGPPERDVMEKVFDARSEGASFEKNSDKRIYMVKAKDKNVGFVQFSLTEEGIELGYSILDEEQGKGYGSAALSEAVKLASGIRSWVIAEIRDDNEASKRVIEKAGLKPTEEGSFEFFKGTGEVFFRKWKVQS